MNDATVLPKLAPINQLRDRVAAIKRISLENTDIDFLKQRLTLLFRGYALSAPVLGREQVLYRGVLWPERPMQLRQLWHPPPDRVHTWGRANRPGQPMFYASTSRAAVFFELDVAPGQFVALSRWRVCKKLWANNVGFTSEVMHSHGSTRKEPPHWEQRNPPPATPANRLVHNFFAESFARKVEKGHEHEYKLSVAITEKLFGNLFTDGLLIEDLPKDPRFAAIVYPSLAMSANSDNIVIIPEFVESGLRLERVEYIRVDDIVDAPGYKITLLDFCDSMSLSTNLDWKGRVPQWRLAGGDTLRFQVEDHEWVAYAMQGGRVDPD
jgi:hypothetical protein